MDENMIQESVKMDEDYIHEQLKQEPIKVDEDKTQEGAHYLRNIAIIL